MGKSVPSSLLRRLISPKTVNNDIKGGAKGYNNIESLFQLISEKQTFFILIFANLFLQLGLTYYTMETTDAKKYKNNYLLLVVTTFILLLVLIFIPMPSYLKVLVFLAFSYIWGLLLSSIKTNKNEKQIHIAIEGALSIFGAMILVGLGLLAGGIKLGYQFGLFLFIALLLLIIARLVSRFSGSLSSMQLGLSIFGIVLFSLYVLYDTNVIFRRDYYGDFITASMDYYLDILNLFLNLLNTEN
jgi:FtsH-binding integral membrane protein